MHDDTATPSWQGFRISREGTLRIQSSSVRSELVEDRITSRVCFDKLNTNGKIFVGHEHSHMTIRIHEIRCHRRPMESRRFTPS
jgi:hypothetical protein